jgi:hypothetical protein
LAVSADGNAAIAFDLLTDGFLNVTTAMTYVDRDVWLPLAVYGQKLNADGTLIFQPLTDGIDIHDGASGLLRNRVQLPIQLSNVYDAVALDNADDLLFAITSTGIAQIDLRSLETMSSSLSFPKRGPAGPRMNVQQGHASYSRRPLSNENFLGLPRLRRRNPRLTPEKVQ